MPIKAIGKAAQYPPNLPNHHNCFRPLHQQEINDTSVNANNRKMSKALVNILLLSLLVAAGLQEICAADETDQGQQQPSTSTQLGTEPSETTTPAVESTTVSEHPPGSEQTTTGHQPESNATAVGHIGDKKHVHLILFTILGNDSEAFVR